MALNPNIVNFNAAFLSIELEWLKKIIDTRLRLYFNDKPPFDSINKVVAPPMKLNASTYETFMLTNKLDFNSRLLVILTLAPYLKPELLDVFLAKNATYDKKFSEFGGIASNGSSFVPSVETALFLLAGSDLKKRFAAQSLFSSDSFLIRNRIIKVESPSKSDPFFNSKLSMGENFTNYFINGEMQKPDYSEDFPAKIVTTELEWSDAVLSENTYAEVMEIKDWIEFGSSMMSDFGLGKRLKPGYKALFYGPPGTGKTMTVSLIGKSTGHDVYRIDLSMLVSKYIGETEKNLAKVFDLAADQKWILFFDEADALFGKRTDVSSSHDRFANQEVAYLLQRIEDHNGLVILATNLQDNIDNAFSRRFQTVIHFPSPGPEERFKIWKQSFAEKIKPDADVDLKYIADKYEITGGFMMNVIRFCSLKAVKNKQKSIPQQDIELGIRKELQKDGIILS